MGNLQAHHNTDVPLATQRSDDWPLEEVYMSDPKEGGPETLQTLDGRRVRNEWRKLDEERRRKGAEVLLKEEK